MVANRLGGPGTRKPNAKKGFEPDAKGRNGGRQDGDCEKLQKKKTRYRQTKKCQKRGGKKSRLKEAMNKQGPGGANQGKKGGRWDLRESASPGVEKKRHWCPLKRGS